MASSEPCPETQTHLGGVSWKEVVLNDRKRKERWVKESILMWKTPVLQASKIPATGIASFKASKDLKGWCICPKQPCKPPDIDLPITQKCQHLRQLHKLRFTPPALCVFQPFQGSGFCSRVYLSGKRQWSAVNVWFWAATNVILTLDLKKSPDKTWFHKVVVSLEHFTLG